MKLFFYFKNFILDNFNIVRGAKNQFDIKGKFYKVRKDIRGSENTISVGKNSLLKKCKIFIRGNNNKIIIESNVNLNNVDLWIEDDDNLIHIADDTTIESGHLAVTENNKRIIIGKNCMFSTNVTIRTGDSHSIIDLESGVRINYAKNVEIDDNVWIGANATILKGTKIGCNSIVGTGSIVNGIFESNSIVGGVPGKVIKKNVSWKRERI